MVESLFTHTLCNDTLRLLDAFYLSHSVVWHNIHQRVEIIGRETKCEALNLNVNENSSSKRLDMLFTI